MSRNLEVSENYLSESERSGSGSEAPKKTEEIIANVAPPVRPVSKATKLAIENEIEKLYPEITPAKIQKSSPQDVINLELEAINKLLQKKNSKKMTNELEQLKNDYQDIRGMRMFGGKNYKIIAPEEREAAQKNLGKELERAKKNRSHRKILDATNLRAEKIKEVEQAADKAIDMADEELLSDEDKKKLKRMRLDNLSRLSMEESNKMRAGKIDELASKLKKIKMSADPLPQESEAPAALAEIIELEKKSKKKNLQKSIAEQVASFSEQVDEHPYNDKVYLADILQKKSIDLMDAETLLSKLIDEAETIKAKAKRIPQHAPNRAETIKKMRAGYNQIKNEVEEIEARIKVYENEVATLRGKIISKKDLLGKEIPGEPSIVRDVREKILRMHPALVGKDLEKDIEPNMLTDLRIDALRELIDTSTNDEKKKMYNVALNAAKKDREVFVAKHMNTTPVEQKNIPTMIKKLKDPGVGDAQAIQKINSSEKTDEIQERKFAEIQDERLILELQKEALVSSSRSDAEKRIASLDKRIEQNIELSRKISEENFIVLKEPNIYEMKKKLEDIIAEYKIGDAVQGAKIRLARVNEQIKEAEAILSERGTETVDKKVADIHFGGLTGKESVTATDRGRAGFRYAANKEIAKQAASPYAKIESLIEGAITEPLMRGDVYVPEMLREQRRKLELERRQTNNKEFKKDIDRIIGKIDSALRNVDADRAAEAAGTLEARYKELLTQRNATHDRAASEAMDVEVEKYRSMLVAASRDERDTLTEDINSRSGDLQKRYGLTNEDFAKLTAGKVSFFSSPRLWLKQAQMGYELEQIRKAHKQRDRAVRNMQA